MSKIYATLVPDKKRAKLGRGLPAFGLLVQTSDLPEGGLKKVKLSLYECDFHEADPARPRTCL